MLNKETLLNILIVVLAGLLVLSAARCIKLKHLLNDLRYQVENIKTKTDSIIVTRYDTLFFEKPVYKTKEILRHDTVEIHDLVFLNDTSSVVIPVEQKYYDEDSLYKAWISGWNPSLDSIYVYPKTIYKEVRKDIVKTKRTRWGIGPSILIGYDIQHKLISPTIGVSLLYNIWSW